MHDPRPMLPEQPARPARRSDTFPCRYRSLVRLCHAKGISPLQAAKKAGVDPRKLRAMRAGENVELDKYYRLANVLETDPTALCFIPEGPCPVGDRVRAFAHRVEELLDEAGAIPEFHPDTGQRVDVVDWVWQLDDPVISSIPLTHREEREAYYLLRDERLRLCETPKFIGPRRLPIGAMHVGPTPLADILDDFDARYELGCKAFDALKHQYEVDRELFHLNRIKTELPGRFQNYLRAKELDEENIDDKGRYHINETTVNALLDADFHVRKIVYPTFQQDQNFFHTYSRSRKLIHRIMTTARDEFNEIWPALTRANTADLQDYQKAWDVDLAVEQPDWDRMKQSLQRTIGQAKALVKRYYPAVTSEDKDLVSEKKAAD